MTLEKLMTFSNNVSIYNIFSYNLTFLLDKDMFTDIQLISKARIPILKLMDIKTGIRCDIAIRQNLVYRKTLLFKTYALSDPRILQLIFAVKYWAKSRKLDDASPTGGTLNTYTHTLMLLAFLQMKGVIPQLQGICCCPNTTTTTRHDTSIMKDAIMWPLEDRYFKASTTNLPRYMEKVKCLYCKKDLPICCVDGLNTYFYTGKLPVSNNQDSTGKLLLEFFKYYALQFDMEKMKVSIRSGGFKPYQDVEKRLRVEDPFETIHNCAHSSKPETWNRLRWEYQRAFIDLATLGCDGLFTSLSSSPYLHQ
jgi:DNA polymerase sigma